MKKRRLTKADLILADPVIAHSLATAKALRRTEDVSLLNRLVKRLDGRVTGITRSHVGQWLRIHRDPTEIARRYLRRYSPGTWHQGGSHVARPGFGPGIAFPRWRNDRNVKLRPYLIDL